MIDKGITSVKHGLGTNTFLLYAGAQLVERVYDTSDTLPGQNERWAEVSRDLSDAALWRGLPDSWHGVTYTRADTWPLTYLGSDPAVAWVPRNGDKVHAWVRSWQGGQSLTGTVRIRPVRAGDVLVVEFDDRPDLGVWSAWDYIDPDEVQRVRPLLSNTALLMRLVRVLIARAEREIAAGRDASWTLRRVYGYVFTLAEQATQLSGWGYLLQARFSLSVLLELELRAKPVTALDRQHFVGVAISALASASAMQSTV